MIDDATVVASQAELEQFRSTPASERKLTPAIRGVLVETATTGIVRYPWPLLRPVISDLIMQILESYEEAERAEVGPPKPLQTAESIDALRENLQRAMAAFDVAGEPPFTVQRLCEVVLEPAKQYKSLDKVAMSIEKLLLVTTTVPVDASPPPPPALSSLPPVNECPEPEPRGQQRRSLLQQQQQQGSGLGLAAVAMGNGDLASAAPAPAAADGAATDRAGDTAAAQEPCSHGPAPEPNPAPDVSAPTPAPEHGAPPAPEEAL